MNATPPRLAEWLLRRLLPAEDAEAIAGDLEETLRASAPACGARAARRWYWRQAASVLWAHARQQPVDPPDPDRPRDRPRMLMPAFRQDLAYALRNLRTHPGFALTAIVMLALGIGANVAIFSIVNALLLKPLPFAHPDRLMIVHLVGPSHDEPGVSRRFIWSYPKYVAFRDQQRAFEAIAAFGAWSWNVTGSGSPERVEGELVESTYFDVLGVTPQVGRTFSADETRAPGSVPLVMLGDGWWTRRFGRDPSIVGRTVGLNGVPHTVVGVLPRGFKGMTGQADAWAPLTTLSPRDLGEAWNHSYTVIGRRAPEISAANADAESRLIAERVDRQYPDPGAGRHVAWSATAVPLDDDRVDALIRQSVLILLGAVATVLLIVCINLANLMLVRGLGREREVAIRLALGASRSRIVRQMMTESAVLAALGAVAALGVAYAAVSAGAALLPDLRMVLPRGDSAGLTRVGLGRLGLDASTLVFAIGAAAGATLLFGLGPAWRASRRDLAATMKSGASGAISAGTSGWSIRSLLIVGEVALALVLLTAGGLMTKSVAKLQATELGFEPSSLLTIRLVLPGPQYNRASGTAFFDALVARIAAQGGIDAAAYGSCAPVSGGCNGTTATFPDRPAAAPGANPAVGVLWASPSYFDTLRIPLVRGRVFTDRDRTGQPKVAIVNEAAAKAFWQNEDPIGRRIGVGQGGFQDGAEVLGVVSDVRYGSVERSVAPDVYLPLLQSPRTNGIIFVRSRLRPDALVPSLRHEVAALDPDLPLTEVKLMEERFGDATWRTRASAWLLGVFSGLALLLAALGIYGVMSQGVEQRTREIGVRMALGAARGDILRLIISRVVVVALVGIVLGLVAAVPAMQLLATLLYRVTPRDPFVYSGLALLLLAVAVLAGYMPARRASRVDPLTTLRAE